MAHASLNVANNVTLIPPYDFSGSVQFNTYAKVASGPLDETNIAQLDAITCSDDQQAELRFKWTQNGSLFAMLSGCTWQLDCFLERVGPNLGLVSKSLSIPFTPGVGIAYEQAVIIPANDCPQGLYRIAVRMMLVNIGALGNETPVIGFADLGLIQYIDA